MQQFVDDGLLEESVLDEFGAGMSNNDLKEIELTKIKAIMELQKVKLQYDQELAIKRLQAGVPTAAPVDASSKFRQKHKEIWSSLSDKHILIHFNTCDYILDHLLGTYSYPSIHRLMFS